MKAKRLIVIIAFTTTFCSMPDKVFLPNYDESLIPGFPLPEPLEFENGRSVNTIAEWTQRRNEILDLFEKKVYGVAPPWEGITRATTIYEDKNAFEGTAVIKEVKLSLQYEGRELDMYVLFHLPKMEYAVPLFLGCNFYGNHTTTSDTNVRITDSWVNNNNNFFIVNNRASSDSRGLRTYRWPAQEIVARGYGLATVYYGDIDPDFDDGFKNGVHGLMDKNHRRKSWGSVAAWAWGLSRVMDYLEAEGSIDASKVMVMGHSRLGKAALWAGATDERFAMVISNNSGCVGAALSRRKIGETVGRINYRFPHWFAGNFKRYNRKEHLLPVDQHQLLALIAPRPLYVASAVDDNWADQRGEFLSCVEASPVYELLGLQGLPVTKMPPVHQPMHGTIGYHIRSGGHDIILYDWLQYLDFADKHLGRVPQVLY